MTVAARRPRPPSRFTQRDLVRALKGALAAGLVVAEAMVTRDGDIRLVFGEPVSHSRNPLDIQLGCHGPS